MDHAYERSGKRRRVRVEEERRALGGRGDLLQGFQPFPAHREFKIEKAGDVATRSRHVGDEATAERINNVHEQDWDGARFLHQRGYGRCTHADNEVGFEIDELPSECAHLGGPAGPQRNSMLRLRPSAQPSPLSPCCKAAMRACASGSVAAKPLNTAIRRTPSDSWAIARCDASSQAPTLPTRVMNPRRLILAPHWPGRRTHPTKKRRALPPSSD